MPTNHVPLIAPNNVYDNGIARVQWNLAAGESGDAYTNPTRADRTVQFSGTFGGATVVLEGRLDPTLPWETLTDPQGNDISKSTADMEAISENIFDLRPRVIGGDGTTAIVVTLMSRRESL